MPNRFFTKSTGFAVALTASALLVFASSYFAKPQPVIALTPNPAVVQNDCAATTDAALTQEVRASLQKAFPNAATRKKIGFTFNVSGGVVTLLGGVSGAANYLNVLKAVKGIPHRACIKALDVKNFEPVRPGGCDDNTQQECNGGCISKNAACNEL